MTDPVDEADVTLTTGLAGCQDHHWISEPAYDRCECCGLVSNQRSVGSRIKPASSAPRRSYQPQAAKPRAAAPKRLASKAMGWSVVAGGFYLPDDRRDEYRTLSRQGYGPAQVARQMGLELRGAY